MFLQLQHQKLDVYNISKNLINLCYKTTKYFPQEERFNLVQQIRRAALSVFLNIAEGSSRKSATERNRFFEISRGSLVEIDAAYEVAEALNYCSKENLEELGKILVRCFSVLSKLIQIKNSRFTIDD